MKSRHRSPQIMIMFYCTVVCIAQFVKTGCQEVGMVVRWHKGTTDPHSGLPGTHPPHCIVTTTTNITFILFFNCGRH